MNEAVYKAILQATLLKVMWENARNLSHPPDENFLLKHWWPILPCRGRRACTTSSYPDGGDKCSGKLFQLMLLNCGFGEHSWESLGLQGDQTNQSWRKSVLNIHWKDWRWSWNSNTLATWCEELIHWKRLWCWERLKAGEGDDRGWEGWMASLTQWTWVWASSRSWWWIGKPGVLWSMGSQRVGHNWVTE